MPSWSGTPHSLGVSHIILRERGMSDELVAVQEAHKLSVHELFGRSPGRLYGHPQVFVFSQRHAAMISSGPKEAASGSPSSTPLRETATSGVV